LTQAFTSPTLGYSIRYPAGWTPSTGEGPIPGTAETFESAAGGWRLRIFSVAVPDGVVVDDWILRNLQNSDDPACMPRRDTQEAVTIGGHEGRIIGFCGVPPAPQIESTVVADKRAYLLTLWDLQEAPSAVEARALFDRFATTITLDPAGAGGSPKPSPS